MFVSLKNSEEADDYEDDGIVLMQHETEGFFRCFGCNEGSLGNPALCVDPASVMKPVLETQERYCGPDFEVIEDGKVVKN